MEFCNSLFEQRKLMNFIYFKKKWMIASFCIFSGCVSLPKDQQTENLIEPPSVDTSINKSLDSGYFSIGDWPKEKWWEIFHSSELNALITESIQQNPTIIAIQKRIEAAKQTANIARSKLFPLLFFDANETWEYLSKNGLYRTLNPKIPLNANLVDLTLSFTYEFDFLGKKQEFIPNSFRTEKSARGRKRTGAAHYNNIDRASLFCAKNKPGAQKAL